MGFRIGVETRGESFACLEPSYAGAEEGEVGICR